MFPWPPEPNISTQFPPIQWRPVDWAREVKDELQKLRASITSTPSIDDSIDPYLSDLRAPTFEEIIHRRVIEEAEIWKRKLNVRKKTRRRLCSSGEGRVSNNTDIPNGSADNNDTRNSRASSVVSPSIDLVRFNIDMPSQDRITGRAEKKQLNRNPCRIDHHGAIDWSEKRSMEKLRLNTKLETYKLSYDFDDYRFKRLFVSYNFSTDPHGHSTRALEAAHPPDEPTNLSTFIHSSLVPTPVLSSVPTHNISPSNFPSSSVSSTPSPQCPNSRSIIPSFVTPTPMDVSVSSGGTYPQNCMPDRQQQWRGWPVLVGNHMRSEMTNNENISTPDHTHSTPVTDLSVGRRTVGTESNSESGIRDSNIAVLRSSLTPVQKDEVIISISFYHPVRGLKSAEFDILGSQTLADLKDSFLCDEDLTFYSRRYPWSCFFIDGVFYSDDRDLIVPDHSMSVNLGHWDGSSFIFLISRIAAHLQKHASPGKVQSTSNCRRSIASSVVGQLDVPFNQRCAYFHRGDCEHRVTFTSMRKFDALFDCPYREAYPLRVFEPATKITLCQACLLTVASKTVFNSTRLPQNPMLLCLKCFQSFFNDSSGKCVTGEDFMHFEYRDVV